MCAKAIGSKYAPDFWGTILIVYKLLTWDDACTVLRFRLAMLCVTLLPLAVMIITSHLSFLDDGYMSYSIIEFDLVPKKSDYLCHPSFADPAPISMQYQSGSKVNFPLCYGVRNLTVIFFPFVTHMHPILTHGWFTRSLRNHSEEKQQPGHGLCMHRRCIRLGLPFMCTIVIVAIYNFPAIHVCWFIKGEMCLACWATNYLSVDFIRREDSADPLVPMLLSDYLAHLHSPSIVNHR